MTQSHRYALQPFVNRLAVRSILTEVEADALLGMKGEVREVRAHSDLVRFGQHVDHSCLVIDGLIGRFGHNRERVRQITCLHIPGDMADLPSVVCPKSAWGLGALSDSTVLRVPHTELRRVAAKHFGIAEAFWRDCVADGSIFSEWVVNVGRRGATARLAHLLCEMAIRCERAGQGDRNAYPLPATQADLGEATGLTNVHVNRTLKELRDQNIVTVRSRQVIIHDWNQLVQIGEFHDGYILLDGPAPRIS
jgi:CRP-like cAMP-binding protein